MNIFYYLFYFILWFNVNYEYSLDLSRNGKIESKIKMECAFTKDAKSYIKVYPFTMKRDSIKMQNGKNVK